MNEMLVWMEDTGGTGADASVEFLSSHGDVWKAWVSADVAACSRSFSINKNTSKLKLTYLNCPQLS